MGSGVGDPFGPRCNKGDIMGCGVLFPRDFEFRSDSEEESEQPQVLVPGLVVKKICLKNSAKFDISSSYLLNSVLDPVPFGSFNFGLLHTDPGSQNYGKLTQKIKQNRKKK